MKERAERENSKAKKSKLVPILISIIVVLALILGYYIYTGYQLKAKIVSLDNQIAQLNADKIDLNSQLNTLQKKYDMLNQDIQQIYKTCPTENACKGRFPGVSWYCNNVGDEATNPSHICVCDVSCNLKATPITQ